VRGAALKAARASAARRSKVSAGADEAGRSAVPHGCGATETRIRVRATTNLSSRRCRNATHSLPLSPSLSLCFFVELRCARTRRTHRESERAVTHR